jgi:TRAP-type C4-dicarboxylate transport system permease large subunit
MFIDTMKATAKTGTMIIFLVIAGFCLSFVLSYVGVATRLAEMIVASGTNRWIVMILLYILWFILGCLMDPASMVILTIPFIYPTLTKLGFDPIWVGIVSTLCVEIGMITPPVGLNLFVLRAVTPVEMRHIIRGSLPYVLVLLTGLVILNIFPGLALMIPK